MSLQQTKRRHLGVLLLALVLGGSWYFLNLYAPQVNQTLGWLSASPAWVALASMFGALGAFLFIAALLFLPLIVGLVMIRRHKRAAL